MKQTALILFLFIFCSNSKGQDRYVSKNAFISFLSETVLEDIYAETNEATSLIDLKTGEVVFSVLITSFHFKRKLMEEHFNENFIESDKFPKATFSGKINNINALDRTSVKSQEFKVAGKIKIHGVEKPITAQVNLSQSPTNLVYGESTFILKPNDFDIKIPTIVFQKIAEELKIQVKASYKAFKK